MLQCCDMSTQTHNQQDWTVEDVYNLIMEEIEPELTTHMVEHLDDIYKDETKIARAERAERYKNAFELFQGIWSGLTGALKADAQGIKDSLIDQMKKKANVEDDEAMKNLEDAFLEDEDDA